VPPELKQVKSLVAAIAEELNRILPES